jgi:hypothetical protein
VEQGLQRLKDDYYTKKAALTPSSGELAKAELERRIAEQEVETDLALMQQSHDAVTQAATV